MPISQEALDTIRLDHARQLAGVQLQADKATKAVDVGSNEFFEIPWIKDNIKAIEAAQSSQCVSSSADTPNWDAVLYALIETSVLVHRNETSMKAAAEAAAQGDLEKAVDHIQQSQKPIDEVAQALDCTFVQFCVLSPQPGSIALSGAFCGAFISHKDPQRPFIGIAFKETDPCPSLDILTDIAWLPTTPKDVLFGAKTHTGFYQGLFGCFPAKMTGSPFDHILRCLEKNYIPNSVVHFTGHSMGAAYATLAYGEFLRRGLNATYKLGGLYVSGAPRVCEQPFAQEVLRLTRDAKATAFRIVNHKDPIPTVPPPFPHIPLFDNYPYIHIDSAWKIFPDGPPEQMASEQPHNPVAPYKTPDWEAHDPAKYYESWKNTPHTK